MKERLVIYNEEYPGGRARVTSRRGASSTCRLNRDKIVYVAI